MAFQGFKVGRISNQTGLASGVQAGVTFDQVAYNAGGFYASNAWVPPAGNVSMYCSLEIQGTLNINSASLITVLKNGAAFATLSLAAEGVLWHPNIIVNDVANGTDSYSIAITPFTTAGTCQVNGSTAGINLSYWCGYVLPASPVPEFSAIPSGAQAGIVSGTPTTLQFGTTKFDTTSSFSNPNYVPPRALYLVHGHATGSGTFTQGAIQTAVLAKNGTAFSRSQRRADTTLQAAGIPFRVVDASGLDQFSLIGTWTTSAGTVSVNAPNAFFGAQKIADLPTLIVFRKTLSRIGGRVGTRQTIGWGD